MKKTNTKEQDAGKRKLDDVIEEIESQQDEILALLQTVNKKKIELIKSVIRLEKVVQKLKDTSSCVPPHSVEEYNEAIERCSQCIERAKGFIWKINKQTETISVNGDEGLWVQIPTPPNADPELPHSDR